MEAEGGGETQQQFTVPAACAGFRVDLFLASQIPTMSRSRIARQINAGVIRLNGSLTRPGVRLREGDVLTVPLPSESVSFLQPWPAPLDIIYEDDDLVVVNKPAGMVVHPGVGHPHETLMNALIARYPEIAERPDENDWPGIVHRLDKDTSGVMVAARSGRALRHLRGQFQRREVCKVYLALVVGRLEPAVGRIEAPIGRHRRKRQQMAVRAGGRDAYTTYRVREFVGDYTLIEASPETGRTHQIRVHLAAIGHPVAGDPVYGGSRAQVEGLGRQFLHAWKISFRMPSGKRTVVFEAPLASDLQAALDRLREMGAEQILIR